MLQNVIGDIPLPQQTLILTHKLEMETKIGIIAEVGAILEGS